MEVPVDTHGCIHTTTVVVVLGEKPENKREIHAELEDRLTHAARYTTSDSPGDVHVVFTGGITRKGCIAESWGAISWVGRQNNLFRRGTTLHTEDHSKTTWEHIVEAQNLLRQSCVIPTLLVIICRKSQLPKVRVFVPRLWTLGTPEIKYVGGVDTKPLIWRIVDQTIFVALAYIDPHELWIARWVNYALKKVARNG